jgi:UDP-N-acetylglucosamine diphosphorylase/glucosamine-1-phosphate N-acetyltransferase
MSMKKIDTGKSLVVILMAGGLGKRMESELPKVLHKIGKIPMIVRILNTIRELNQKIFIEKTMIVVGKYKDIISQTISEYMDISQLQFVTQAEALGTGHAIQCCQPFLFPYMDHNILILSGDTPLLTVNTLIEMVCEVKTIRIMTAKMENPSGYGRILLTKDGKFNGIKEEKDCDEEQKKITLINGGIYTIDCQLLCRYLPHLKNNNRQGEYYLTDVVGLINEREELDIEMFEIPFDNRIEIMGVNTKSQLLELETIILKPT